MKRLALFSVLALLLGGVVGASTALAGPPEVRVPRVVDLDLEQARAHLGARGLEAEVQWSAHAEPGKVVAQSPRPGALVRAGDAVELVVGLRIPVETLVPSVVGMAEEEAVDGLAPVYAVEIVEVPAGRRREGRVVAQEPVAGTRLPFRGVLRLSIGREGLEPETTVIPTLVGSSLADAEQALLDQGLVPHPAFVRGRPGAAWDVTRQDPAPGAVVDVGSRVGLEVVRPRGWSARVRVPSLHGLDAQAAIEVLASLGLQAEGERRPSLFPTETVVRSAPARGESATRGSAVRLLVAVPGHGHGHRRRARIAVPNLRHRSLADVRTAVREAGLRLAVRRVVAPERPPEHVIVQSPAAGTSARLGAIVRIDLPKLAEVPLLLGRDVAAARQIAADHGFDLHLEGDEPRRHRGTARVVDQHPASGTIAAVGTTLRAVVRGRRGGRHVEVPDLMGVSETVARERLRAVGLEARFTGPRLPVSVLLEVVAQDHEAGARVRRGTTISATLGLRPRRVSKVARVPEVIGLSLSDAERMLTAAGFVVRAAFVRGAGPRGVTGQMPGAGSLHPRGGEVRVTVRR